MLKILSVSAMFCFARKTNSPFSFSFKSFFYEVSLVCNKIDIENEPVAKKEGIQCLLTVYSLVFLIIERDIRNF